MKTEYITKKELGKIPNIKTELGLKMLLSKKDNYNNSKDYDYFFFKGFLYQIESIGWDYGSIYTSIDAGLKIETQIFFNNSNNRLFKDFEVMEIMSWRNDITYFTLNKNFVFNF